MRKTRRVSVRRTELRTLKRVRRGRCRRQGLARHAHRHDARYELRAAVCFYGAHYAAFCRTDEGWGPWTRFDDSSVTVIGDWPALVDACARGHLQPTVLFYELMLPQTAPP